MRILVCAGVCLAAVFGSARPAFAQEDRAASVGIKAGLTSTTLAVTGLSGFEPERRTGLLAGAFVTIGRKAVRLQPELILTSKNFQAASPIGVITVDSRSIDVPLLLVARLAPEAKVHPRLFAGPFLGVISKATQTVDGVETNIKDQLTGTDAGVVVGAGLEIPAGRGGLLFDARYVIGVKDISRSNTTTFRSRTWMFSAGYRF